MPLPPHTPYKGTPHRLGRHLGRAATPGSHRASPWWARAVCASAVAEKKGGGASEQAGRGGGRLAVNRRVERTGSAAKASKRRWR